MAAPRPGQMIEVVQFRRATSVHDGISEVETFADFGTAQRARKIDASDAERWQAAEVSASLSARFQLRRNEVTEVVTSRDRLACRGIDYEITGKREMVDDLRFFEFSTVARIDRT
ncbi:head-tail adaptor protein [Chachezhania antarctica]|uniref:phage head completion protein n=1 Tax=Chachezhania antarctica TaxID=2340860 RepID=UPI0013CED54D|nr:head-tail adaptor protein [Chachezhania antarctica]|tara:strand:- start:3612 stop:3956 length:345 start_codon:yes stop_codon:yes gene_type:complete